jgi:hypothetical protein
MRSVRGSVGRENQLSTVAPIRSSLDTALALAASGLSVIPIKRDGTKAPALAAWAEFQTRIASPDEIRSMFSAGLGVAIVCGEASGNLEVLDIEAEAPFDEFCDVVRNHDDALIDALTHICTPSGGHHLFYRCDEISGNQKLAMKIGADGTPEVIFETRAKGGYVVTIGSPAACHEAQREYRLVYGRLTQIQRITPEQRALLLDVARSFNQVVKRIPIDRKSAAVNGNGNGTRPGDLFNARTSWPEVLEPHGWVAVGIRGELTTWRRPGKDFSFSATTNYHGSDLLYVFSTSAYPFEHETSYSKFAAYAHLNHGGDYRAAAKELAQRFGMSDERPRNEAEHSDVDEERAAIQQESAQPEILDGEQRPTRFPVPAHWKMLDASTMDEWQCEPLRPIVEGIIVLGNLVNIAAQSQTGKTLLCLYLARLIVQGGLLFGKFPVTPVDKVLYLCLEDPDRRVKARMLDTDHEFSGRPQVGALQIHVAPGLAISDPHWSDYLEFLISSEKPAVIFLDTYQKATPGLSSFKDEDQSKILHGLADLTRKHNVTIIIIDHIRKDDTRGKRGELTLDDIKGSGAKAQNADCVILMQRAGEARDQIKFQSFSKDFDKPIGVLVKVAPQGSTEPKFQYVADLADLGKESHKKKLEQWNTVLDVMTPGEPYSSPMVATLLKLEGDGGKKKTQRDLNAMANQGLVRTDGAGKYKVYIRPLQVVE